MNELREAGADTLSTGFTDREIDDLIGEIGQEIDEEEDADIEANERKADDSDEIKCYVGTYKFKLTQDEFDGMIADVREKVGFTRQLVEEEIKRRLFRA